MKKKRLIWQLFPSYLLIILIALLFITCYSTYSLKRFYQEQTIRDLKAKAYLVENQLEQAFYSSDSKAIDELCKKMAGDIALRITVILPNGKVIGDSDEAPETMDNHHDRPEVTTAFSGEAGSAIRFSHTLNQEMVYVALPVFINNKTAFFIRTSMPLMYLQKALKKVYLEIIFTGLVIAIITGLLCYRVSKSISKPLEQLEEGAKLFAKGDLKSRLPEFKTREIENLARTMNMMAAQLDERIQEIIRQNKQQKVVLCNMKEGIIAVDTEQKLLKINNSAAKMFNIEIEEAKGKKISELIDNEDFLHFIEEASINNKTLEDSIIMQKDREQFIQIYSSPIYDEKNFRTSTLIVLNDITRIKKLENIRRDFVANVSHELRTPITSIKGFVETLLDGDLNEPEETKSFLQIIKKHVSRLNAIIEDLLSISRLEQGSDTASIPLEKVSLKNVLKSAVQTSEMRINTKNIGIKLDCPDDIEINARPSLIEQAVINLINNAVNYSEEGSFIEVEGEKAYGGVIIKVRDHGCGIAKEHLSRIFERFYRVDKARSRKLGGTGLGLAIVKHIASTHGGNVRVESEIGQGSTFYLQIPG